MSIAGTIGSIANSSLSQASQIFGQSTTSQASFPDPASLNSASPAPGVPSDKARQRHHHHQPDATAGQQDATQQVAGGGTGGNTAASIGAVTGVNASTAPTTAGNLLSADLDHALQSYSAINNLA